LLLGLVRTATNEDLLAAVLRALAMGEIGMPQPELEKILAMDAGPHLQIATNSYLARRNAASAIPRLVAALSHPDPLVRMGAIDDLDDLGYAEALHVIQQLTRDDDRDVADAARTFVENRRR